MRLTMLLDQLERLDEQVDAVPSALATVPTSDADTFDRLVAGLVPCRAHDPELWFAEQSADVEYAKSLCRECPIRQGCLDGAVARQEPWGVWGGEVFVGGVVVATKRGRGRPRKTETHAA